MTTAELLLECKSRSGLCPLDPTGGDGSDFDICCLTAFAECYKYGVPTTDEIINKFMTLHHNIIVKHKHFNWNW